MKDILKRKLRKERAVQYSGNLKISKLPILKEKHYCIVDVPLDGEAPKQYIKAYFYHPNCPRVNTPKTWAGFYAKFGGKSYPHESAIEYAINKLGEGLGINMNETRLVVINQQLRFLSKDFIKRGQRLIHGIEILAEYFEDKEFVEEINKDKKTRREYLTFDVIEKAISYVYPNEAPTILNELIKMITFDAIAGNNDRHFYNWGVIGDTKKITDNGVVFAPIYDSARGLFWNQTQENLLKMYGNYQNSSHQIDAYLNKSEPRFSFAENPKASHFELIDYLVSYKKEYKSTIEYLSTLEKETQVLKHLEDSILYLFSLERRELMIAVIQKRFKRIRSLL